MDRTRAAAPAIITRALQVSELADGLTSVVWTADFLPDDIGGYHVEGDRGGDGGDAAVAGRAGGIAKDVDEQRGKADEAALRPDRFTPTLRKEPASR